jgi:hypothetical protein
MDWRLILLKAGSFSMHTLIPLLLLHWKLFSNKKFWNNQQLLWYIVFGCFHVIKSYCLSGFLDLETIRKSHRAIPDQQTSSLSLSLSLSLAKYCD